MEDRHAVGRRPLRRLAVDLVVEDGAHRAVGQRADLDCPGGGSFKAIGAESPHQPHDAKAGAEALLKAGSALQELARATRQSLGRSWWPRGECARPSSRHRADGSTAYARARWCPDGYRWRADERRSARHLERSDGTRREPCLDLAARKAVRHAVEMTIELDMVVHTSQRGWSMRKRRGWPG